MYTVHHMFPTTHNQYYYIVCVFCATLSTGTSVFYEYYYIRFVGPINLSLFQSDLTIMHILIKDSFQ